VTGVVYPLTIAQNARALTLHIPTAGGTYRAGLAAPPRAPGIPPPASQESRAFCRISSVHITSHHQVGLSSTSCWWLGLSSTSLWRTSFWRRVKNSWDISLILNKQNKQTPWL
jgi:hypothetical protein